LIFYYFTHSYRASVISELQNHIPFNVKNTNFEWQNPNQRCKIIFVLFHNKLRLSNHVNTKCKYNSQVFWYALLINKCKFKWSNFIKSTKQHPYKIRIFDNKYFRCTPNIPPSDLILEKRRISGGYLGKENILFMISWWKIRRVSDQNDRCFLIFVHSGWKLKKQFLE